MMIRDLLAKQALIDTESQLVGNNLQDMFFPFQKQRKNKCNCFKKDWHSVVSSVCFSKLKFFSSLFLITKKVSRVPRISLMHG